MLQRVTLIDRIVSDDNSALKANKVITDFGFKPARNREQLRENLRLLIADGKMSEKVLSRLGAIHPDKDLILAVAGPEEKMGCDGCGGTCGGKMSADGISGIREGEYMNPKNFGPFAGKTPAPMPNQGQKTAGTDEKITLKHIIDVHGRTILWTTAVVISSIILGKALKESK